MKILLVEDERDLSNAIIRVLKNSKYDVDAVYDGEDALNHLHQNQYEIVITDLMMPKMDGIELIKQMRKENNSTPVLILTAKSQVDDKVEGLDAGADDYLTKPFSIKEFLARIRSLTRRKGDLLEPYKIENLELDHNTFEIRTPYGSLPLTDTEYRLFEYLLRNKDNVLSTERIMENIWGYDTEVEINVVWAYLSSIRKKLAQIQSDITIKAMRGVGYKIIKTSENTEEDDKNNL